MPKHFLCRVWVLLSESSRNSPQLLGKPCLASHMFGCWLQVAHGAVDVVARAMEVRQLVVLDCVASLISRYVLHACTWFHFPSLTQYATTLHVVGLVLLLNLTRGSSHIVHSRSNAVMHGPQEEPELLWKWEESGSTKICLKVRSP